MGNKDVNIEYRKRPGAYAIIKRKKDNKIGIVENITNKMDFFFLGGGIEEGETEIDALKRELIEESGYTIKNINEFDKVGSFVYAGDRGYLEIIANVYTAEFDKKAVEPIEKDHKVLWVSAKEYTDKMSQEWQNYILKEYIEKSQ